MLERTKCLHFVPLVENTSPNARQEGIGKRLGGFAISLMVALVLLGALLRIEGIGRPIWIDEAQTLKWTQKTFAEIIEGNLSPFMPLVAKTMVELCKADTIPDEIIVRIPGIVWGNLTIALLFLYMYRRIGLGAAVMSTLFLAVTRCHIFYSMEARYYSFQIFLSLLFVIFMDRYLLYRKPRDLAVIFLISALGLLNHLSFVFLSAAINAGAILWISIKNGMPWKTRLKQAAIVALIAILAFLPLALLHPGAVVSSIAQFNLAKIGQQKASAPNAEKKSDEVFRLTPAQYQFYLMEDRDFLMITTKSQAAIYVVLAVAGVLTAWMVSGSLGWLLLFVTVFIPLPLFFFSVNHHWSARYFCTQLPVFAMLVGFGSVALRVFYEKWGGRNPWFSVLSLFIPLSLVFAAVIPARLYQYPDRFDSVHHLNVVDTLAFLSKEMHGGEKLAVAPNRFAWWFNGIFAYYLSPASGNSPKLPAGTTIEYVGNSAKLADPIVSGKPWETYWFVLPNWHGEGDKAILKKAGAEKIFSTRLTDVWVRGRATVNMLPGGNFEPVSPQCFLPDSSELVSGPEAWQNGKSLKVRIAGNQTPPIVWFPVLRSGDQGEPASGLENGGTYTLSFRLKHSGIRPDGNAKNILRVLIAGDNAAQDLLYIQNPEDWQPFANILFKEGAPEWKRYEFTFEVGKNVPLDMTSVKIGFGNYGISGMFWLDDVQLEQGAPASPFTLNVRMVKQYQPASQSSGMIRDSR